MFDLSLAIGHHLLVFALFGVLVAELALVGVAMAPASLARIASIDVWYGVVAGVILVLGFTRAILAAKGWDYYEHNLFFWAKIATFALVGLLSVPPTIAFIRWRRLGGAPSAGEVARVRRYLWAEVVLFALLPVFAAAMARGYGTFGS